MHTLLGTRVATGSTIDCSFAALALCFNLFCTILLINDIILPSKRDYCGIQGNFFKV